MVVINAAFWIFPKMRREIIRIRIEKKIDSTSGLKMTGISTSTMLVANRDSTGLIAKSMGWIGTRLRNFIWIPDCNGLMHKEAHFHR